MAAHADAAHADAAHAAHAAVAIKVEGQLNKKGKQGWVLAQDQDAGNQAAF